MDVAGEDRKDWFGSVERYSSRLFGDKCERPGLIQKTQFAVGMARSGRVKVDSSLQKRAMKVRHQRPDVPGPILNIFCVPSQGMQVFPVTFRELF